MNKGAQAVLIAVIVIFAGLAAIRFFSKNNAVKTSNAKKTDVDRKEPIERKWKPRLESKEDQPEEPKTEESKAATKEDEISIKIDINKAEIFDLKKAGLTKKAAQSLISYREKIGAFYSIDDLEKIKGIGGKSIENLRSGFSFDPQYAKTIVKKVNINLIDDEEELGILGFNKKEIVKLKKWKKEKGKIYSNIDMINIFESQERYNYTADRIYYTDY